MPTLTSTISGFVVGDDLKIIRTISNIPSGDSIAKAWLTVKKSAAHADAAAIFQKSLTGSYVAGQGQITDTGSGDTAGSVFFELLAADTVLLKGDVAYFFDVQVLLTLGAIYTPELGTITGRPQVTKAII